MAAPHVTGAFAVLKEKSPNASVTDLLMILQTTGVAVTDGGNNITKRRINLGTAINALCTPNSYNLVGFQNHLRFGEQKRVLRLIPGLEEAEFLRFGQVHRNTFICAPAVIGETLQMRSRPRILFAGQISGVEGYIEAMATGFLAGVNAAEIARGRAPLPAPRRTAMGSLANYIANADVKNFQPMNITFALLPPLDEADRRRLKKKSDRRRLQVEMALRDFEDWRARYLE